MKILQILQHDVTHCDIAFDSLILGNRALCVTIQSLSSLPSLVPSLECSFPNKTPVDDPSSQWSPFGRNSSRGIPTYISSFLTLK